MLSRQLDTRRALPSGHGRAADLSNGGPRVAALRGFATGLSAAPAVQRLERTGDMLAKPEPAQRAPARIQFMMEDDSAGSGKASGARPAVAEAVEWLRHRGWIVPPQDIVNPELTAGNCHSRTFHGADLGPHNSIGTFLEEWNRTDDILLCLTGTRVDHSATRTPAGWLQTLPDGPTFVTDTAFLKQKYTCYELADADQLGQLEAMASAQRESRDEGLPEARAAFLQRWKGLYDRFKEDPKGDEHYLVDWYNQVQIGSNDYGEVGLGEIAEFNEQLVDMFDS